AATINVAPRRRALRMMDVPYRSNLSTLQLDSSGDDGDDPSVVDRPAVTVRDVLRLALPASTVVVGGEVGLERAVTWARLIQWDETSFERLEPGDLALASLPPLRDTPHAVLASILQSLAARGLSVLAVASSFPTGAQALADAIGTPLLAMPMNARLVDVEKTVIGLIINRRAELEQRGV